jgi:hypothetical protein
MMLTMAMQMWFPAVAGVPIAKITVASGQRGRGQQHDNAEPETPHAHNPVCMPASIAELS